MTTVPGEADQPDAHDETTVASEYLYRGRVVTLRLDQVRLADGREVRREVVEHPGAVAVVPMLPDGRVILIRQYRRPAGQALLEIPAGTREPDEDAETCARRELIEEIGYRAGRITRLGGFFTSPGFATEYMDVFLAEEMTPVEEGGPAEFEEAMVVIGADEAPRLLAAGEPIDAKTLAALSLALARR